MEAFKVFSNEFLREEEKLAAVLKVNEKGLAWAETRDRDRQGTRDDFERTISPSIPAFIPVVEGQQCR
jgi:hypothetical protein